MSGNYYNENDKNAVAWLRELIKAGLIADGEVDERSIEDVRPNELAGFRQCHFFAGIGAWSYALRRAGWDDSRPVWTGSAPCQSFSAAGRRRGFYDERHLWPDWFRLIRECRPVTVFGEQIASKDGLAWLDFVCTDLEAEGYAVGSVSTVACGFGAPHIRQRLYFVADAESEQHNGHGYARNGRGQLANGSATGELGYSIEPGLEGHARHGNGESGRDEPHRSTAETSASGGMADADESDGQCSVAQRSIAGTDGRRYVSGSGEISSVEHATSEQVGLPGRARQRRETNGYWSDADWIDCADGKARPVEPKLIKMVAGTAGGVGFVCDSSAESDESKKINAAKDKADAAETLCVVSVEVGAEALQRSAGKQSGIQASEILRSSVHGGGAGRRHQDNECTEQPASSAENCQTTMRDVQPDGTPSCASSGRESHEQRSIELADFMRLLPSSLALAELHGDTVTEEAMRTLLATDGAARSLLDAPDAIQKVWRCHDDEGKDGPVHLRTAAGCFVRTIEHPLTQGAEARTMRLRGYGNSLCAPAAKEFIAAYMEVRQRN